MQFIRRRLSKSHFLDPAAGNDLTPSVIAHYSPNPVRKELTVRGLIIGIIITLVFTAANVYFGLKQDSRSLPRFLQQ